MESSQARRTQGLPDAPPAAAAGKEQILAMREAMPTYVRELIAGGVAGGFAKSAIAPLERIKILFQTRAAEFQSIGVWRSLGCIARTEGIRGLYRGNGAGVVRIVPYAALHFMTYEHYQRWFVDNYPSVGTSVHLFAGSLAGGTAVLATYPLDLARTRLAYQVPGDATRYKGFRSVLVAVYSETGARGLYRGIVPTLYGILPYAGLKFFIYEELKSWLPPEHSRSTFSKLACGAVAGLIGQTCTYPLDVVRRRMQVQNVNQTTFGCLSSMARTQGFKQMFAGVSINYLKIVPSVAIGFAAYDGMKDWLGIGASKH